MGLHENNNLIKFFAFWDNAKAAQEAEPQFAAQIE